MTNIFSIRDVIEKLFSDAIEQRKEDIQQNRDVARSLATFQKYGNDQMPAIPNTGRINPRGGFFSGVLTALTCVAVSFIWLVFSICFLKHAIKCSQIACTEKSLSAQKRLQLGRVGKVAVRAVRSYSCSVQQMEASG